MFEGWNYLLPALLKTVVLPPILVHILIAHLLPFNLPSICYIAFILYSWPGIYYLRTARATAKMTKEALEKGAIPIPTVKGKYLNLNVMWDWSKSGKEEEVGRMLVLLKRKYGDTYNTKVLGEDSIVTTDPRIVRHILIDEFANFVKGDKFYQRAAGFLGDGIFNSDGERWKFHRNLTRPYFHPSYISPSLFIPSIKRFLSEISLNEPFDIQARLGKLALECSVLWLCGEDISVDSAEFSSEWKEARDQLGDALIDAQRIVGKRVKIGTLWPLFELGSKPLHKPMTVIRTFFRPLIKKSKVRGRSTSDEQRFLHRLVDTTEDTKLIEDQLLNLLFAARDTTTSLLTFLTYALSIHYPIALRLREEVRNVAGYDGRVDKDVIRNLKLSRAFINETLRLFPPVPLNIRRTLRSSLLPSSSNEQPLYMPANTSIIVATVLIHREPSIWGEDANMFSLDRWSNMPSKEREAFISWNIGPRMCLGQPLALTMAHTFLVLLCQHLDEIGPSSHVHLSEESKPESCRVPESWRGVDGDGRLRHGRDEVWVYSDVVLAVKGGLWVKFGESKDITT